MRLSPIRRRLTLAIAVIVLAILPSAAAAGPPDPTPDLSTLESASALPVRVSWDADTGAPAFVAGKFPTRVTSRSLAADPLQAAQTFLARHKPAFGIADATREFRLVHASNDGLGMTHVRLHQVYQDVPVLGAELLVHFDSSGRWVTAVNGDYLAGMELRTVKPYVDAKTALTTALGAMPESQLRHSPTLVVVDGRLYPAATGSHLAWMIELYNQDVPARNVYLIDAHTGFVLDSYDRLTTGRDRKTHTANNSRILPGTLWLTEEGPIDGQAPDQDGLDAHQFAGDTYDYFWSVYGLDSYDGRGAPLISTVHYGNNFQNAFWNGAQMVYGDGFASAGDVVAHELTHAVTEFTANLVYQYQSGALNESFSDIFAVMVDRDDWLIGEDLPIGAIRSMADPPAYGQPDHLDEYDTTCEDNGGVHINSGIPNKAAYLLSQAIGRPAAEEIFYRTLTYYLTKNAGFNDARAAAIKSAEDLFGVDSTEVQETAAAFAAVGLDGVSEPPGHSCDCAVSVTLGDRSLFGDLRFAARSATTLYRVRDQLMRETPAGNHLIDLYYAHTGQMSRLMLKDPSLRADFGTLLRNILPGLSALAGEEGDKAVVTPAMVEQLETVLDGLAHADDGGPLAQAIAVERSRIKLDRLAGLTFAEAWKAINAMDERDVK